MFEVLFFEAPGKEGPGVLTGFQEQKEPCCGLGPLEQGREAQPRGLAPPGGVGSAPTAFLTFSYLAWPNLSDLGAKNHDLLIRHVSKCSWDLSWFHLNFKGWVFRL